MLNRCRERVIPRIPFGVFPVWILLEWYLLFCSVHWYMMTILSNLLSAACATFSLFIRNGIFQLKIYGHNVKYCKKIRVIAHVHKRGLISTMRNYISCGFSNSFPNSSNHRENENCSVWDIWKMPGFFFNEHVPISTYLCPKCIEFCTFCLVTFKQFMIRLPSAKWFQCSAFNRLNTELELQDLRHW